jgi:hypothetical protein
LLSIQAKGRMLMYSRPKNPKMAPAGAQSTMIQAANGLDGAVWETM